jgi:hypothetical protein
LRAPEITERNERKGNETKVLPDLVIVIVIVTRYIRLSIGFALS